MEDLTYTQNYWYKFYSYIISKKGNMVLILTYDALSQRKLMEI